MDESLRDAIDTIPPGRYGVAVSGGADSVALLHLSHRRRTDLPLHVIHLDHGLRGDESTADAAFVADVARRWSIPATIGRRSDIEGGLAQPANPSARYRALRHALFRRVAEEHRLDGVLLAHHADDQAETVLQRLLRHSSVAGLTGMGRRTDLGGLVLLRPLLGVRAAALRDYLRSHGQPWREDLSNASAEYQRNRVRRWLNDHPGVVPALLGLADAAAGLKHWTESNAPPAGPLRSDIVTGLPSLLQERLARAYLSAAGSPIDDLTPDVVARFVAFCTGAASPARMHFPGRLLLRRRKGIIEAAPSPPPARGPGRAPSSRPPPP